MINVDLQALPDDVVVLKQIIRDLVHGFTKEVNEFKSTVKDLTDKIVFFTDEITSLKEQLLLQNKERFGKSSEKLQKLNELKEFQAEEEESSSQSKEKPKRQKLPANLAREEIVHAAIKICPDCGGTSFRKISDDISEQLERATEMWKVVCNVMPRCACNDCGSIVQPYPESSPIYRGIAGPGLLSYVIIQKYCNHLPLYRQTQIYKREGLDLSRSTMAGWMFQCSELLKPLIDKLMEYVFSSTYLHGDDTPVKVLEPGSGKTKTGRIWTYVFDGRNYGSNRFPAVCYFYSPNRKGENPIQHLINFNGILHSDAYSGYNGVLAQGVTKAGFRVDEDVSILTPHRPGRAQLTHPVLHIIRFAL